MQNRTDDRISKFLKTVCEIPSLEAAVQKLVELSDTDASARDFAALILKDQGLAAKVLRLVNSAFYALGKAIVSIPQASALLGTKTLKSLVLSVKVTHLLSKTAAGLEPITFWRHSIATAVASQRLAQLVLPSMDEDLYVAGLFHDAGIALLAKHVSEDYAKVLRAARSPGRNLARIEEELFGISHAEVGGALAARWRLSSLVADAIRFHETEEARWTLSSPDNAKAVSIVMLADAIAAHVGLNFDGAAPAPEALPRPPAILGLDLQEVEAIALTLPSDVAEKEGALAPHEIVAV